MTFGYGVDATDSVYKNQRAKQTSASHAKGRSHHATLQTPSEKVDATG
jgi:hypothetical protein